MTDRISANAPATPWANERGAARASAAFSRGDLSRLGQWFWTIDKLLLSLVMMLIGFGLIAVAAASPVAAHRYSGGNVRVDIRDTTSRVYRKVWEMTAFAGFLTAREAAKVMVPRGRGTLLFTGATASLRGGRGFSAFAGGKHAVRALAQSMARELGPQNIHVAHVVVDGAIDTEWIKTNFPERYAGGPDVVVDPDDIAEVSWQLHRQKRSAWTFEMDLRPWKETW